MCTQYNIIKPQAQTTVSGFPDGGDGFAIHEKCTKCTYTAYLYSLPACGPTSSLFNWVAGDNLNRERARPGQTGTSRAMWPPRCPAAFICSTETTLQTRCTLPCTVARIKRSGVGFSILRYCVLGGGEERRAPCGCLKGKGRVALLSRKHTAHGNI